MKRIMKLVLWLGVGGFIGYYLFFSALLVLAHSQFLDVVGPFFAQGSSQGVNILAFGVDDTLDSKRSDTIMLIHLDPSDQSIGLVSIPRDTRVRVPGVGYTKVNHAFAHGGAQLLMQSVSSFLELPIHHYMQLNLDGVVRFIDRLGGVELDVERDMFYEDRAAGLTIDFKKGRQTLSGSDVVKYIRFRHDREGDIGRIRRQQSLVKAVSGQVIRPGSILNVPLWVRTVRESVRTDLSLREMLFYARQFVDVLKYRNLRTSSIPGSIVMYKGVSYWDPDMSQMNMVVDRVLLGKEDVGVVASLPPTLNNVVASRANLVISEPVFEKESIREPVSEQIKESVIEPPVIEPVVESVTAPLVALDVPSLSVDVDLKEEVAVVIEPVTASVMEAVLALLPEKAAPIVEARPRRLSVPVRLEILNGFDPTFDVEQLVPFFQKMGADVVRAARSGRFDYLETLLVDWHQDDAKSLSLAQVLLIDPDRVIVYDKPAKPLDITLVLGKDWLAIKQLFEKGL